MSNKPGLYIIPREDGTIALGIGDSENMAIFWDFTDVVSLRDFGKGILGFAANYITEVPEAFVNAFAKEDADAE